MLKHMLRRAFEEANIIDDDNSMSAKVYRDYKKKFEALVGQPIIWRTKNNTNLKAPQLVVVEKAYDYFVLVVKTSFNVEGKENKIRYGICYASLYCGNDTFETLEFVS